MMLLFHQSSEDSSGMSTYMPRRFARDLHVPTYSTKIAGMTEKLTTSIAKVFLAIMSVGLELSANATPSPYSFMIAPAASHFCISDVPKNGLSTCVTFSIKDAQSKAKAVI
jgi:hypothetical protein